VHAAWQVGESVCHAALLQIVGGVRLQLSHARPLTGIHADGLLRVEGRGHRLRVASVPRLAPPPREPRAVPLRARRREVPGLLVPTRKPMPCRRHPTGGLWCLCLTRRSAPAAASQSRSRSFVSSIATTRVRGGTRTATPAGMKPSARLAGASEAPGRSLCTRHALSSVFARPATASRTECRGSGARSVGWLPVRRPRLRRVARRATLQPWPDMHHPPRWHSRQPLTAGTT
jgi:hypothetical protein